MLMYWGRRGGPAQRTLTLAQALLRRTDTPLALSYARQAELAPAYAALGVPSLAVDTFRGAAGAALGLARVPGLARALVRHAEGFGAEVVVSVMSHVWTPWVAPALARAGLRYVPMIHDAVPHPGDPALLFEWRLRRELAAAESAIVHSAHVAAAVARRRPGLPLHRLPLAPDLPLAPAPPRPADGGPGPDFLMFGRLRAYKGLDLLRDAWPLLRARHPGARLRVVGEGDAEALAPGLGALPGVAVETRWVPEAEIPVLLAGADAVVMPYREASQSGVVSMALALGVPVVATPVGGLAEQVADGVTGALAQGAAPAPLAEALARLCDPAERARMAAGARAAGHRLGDWDAQAAALVAALSLSPAPPGA